MTMVEIECLRCGRPRDVVGPLDHSLDAGACHRCSYVGWAFSVDLSEAERRELRDFPVEERRFEPVADLLPMS